jgi:hypothetical protein
MNDRYPKVFVTRRLRKDGSAYFGPYFPGNLAYRLVDLIHRSFLIPSCKVDLSRYHPLPPVLHQALPGTLPGGANDAGDLPGDDSGRAALSRRAHT